jgi:hypothetical protein
MPTPLLKVWYISSSSTPPCRMNGGELGGPFPAVGIDLRAESVRDHTRQVLGDAAAGDVCERMDAAGGDVRQQRVR